MIVLCQWKDILNSIINNTTRTSDKFSVLQAHSHSFQTSMPMSAWEIISDQTLTWKWNKVRKMPRNCAKDVTTSMLLPWHQRVCQCEKHVRHQILDLCLRLWFRVQVPRVSHQTSLLGAVSRQVPTLLSRQDNPENVQEVSWQLGEC